MPTCPSRSITCHCANRGCRRQIEKSPLAQIEMSLSTVLVGEFWADDGDSLAAEKLAELHDIHLARETVRQWMITAGVWKDRRARLKAVHQPRYRRDCLGELVQIDGSEHWWFEARGPQCTLLVFIDDATSRLMHLQFVESESTFDYFAATRAYLARYGKPVAFYSDKHGVFRVNRKDAVGGDGMTQFGRALHALNIDIICANSSQAKGRGRARQWNAAGPAGEGDAAIRHRHHRSRQCVPSSVHGAVQCPLCQGPFRRP